MTETPDDLLEPEDPPEEPASEPDDDDQGLGAEQSLGLLPPD